MPSSTIWLDSMLLRASTIALNSRLTSLAVFIGFSLMNSISGITLVSTAFFMIESACSAGIPSCTIPVRTYSKYATSKVFSSSHCSSVSVTSSGMQPLFSIICHSSSVSVGCSTACIVVGISTSNTPAQERSALASSGVLHTKNSLISTLALVTRSTSYCPITMLITCWSMMWSKSELYNALRSSNRLVASLADIATSSVIVPESSIEISTDSRRSFIRSVKVAKVWEFMVVTLDMTLFLTYSIGRIAIEPTHRVSSSQSRNEPFWASYP